MTRCKRCNRQLKSDSSKQNNYGPFCYKKEFGKNLKTKNTNKKKYEFRKMEFNRKLIKTEEDFQQMLDNIKDYKEIAIDTENGGKNAIQALNVRYCKPAGYSISVDGKNGYYIPINHPDIKTNFNNRLKEVMENKKIVIMHNAPYDTGVFYYHYDYDLENLFWFDTAVGQHLIDENNPKGLKKISRRYFGYEQKEFDFNDISTVPSESVCNYACDDAILTFKHYEREKEQLKQESLMDLYKNVEEPFLKVLRHMKINGVQFNVEKCKEMEQELIKRKKELINNVIEKVPQISATKSLFNNSKSINYNLSSAEDLKKILYDKLNLPIKSKTDSGAPAVDTPTLKSYAIGKLDEKDLYNNEWEHPVIPYLIEYKEVEKLLTSYTHSLYEKVFDGRIYPDFNDTGTTSSRLSSNNPNFQQLPKNPKYNVRKFFEASPGYKMYVADFSQEEIRVCGVITKSNTFKKAFENGEDLHLKVANDVWNLGIPEEALLEGHEDYKHYKEKFEKERKNAKFVGFGLMYGRTAHGLQTQLGGSVDDCQLIVDEYFKTYPEIKEEIEKTSKDVKNKGFTRNLFNRKRRFSKFQGKYYTNNVFRQAFNYKIQGSCADILRVVMNKILKYINSLENPEEVKILGTVHDEVIYEIMDNENFEKHVENIKNIMENSVKLDIKLTVEGDTGNNYGECK